MWKFCEVEICPWHEKRSKRKEVSANRKSKKKFFRKDNESDNDREISDDTKIKAKMNCEPGPHIEKEDISPGAARRESEGKITTGPQTSASGLKKRPKTAPASSNQQVVPMDSMKALASLELVSARGLDTAGQGPELLSNSFGSRMVKINKKRIDFILETEKLRRRKQELSQKTDVDASRVK